MLSTPHKRFAWARAERYSEFTFFRTLMLRRPRKLKRIVAARERAASGKWKPAAWTPWLWIK